MNIPKELTTRLGKADEVIFALLFGSRAKGVTRTDSDWDVGVYLSPQLTPKERFDIRLKLVADLQDLGTVDLMILNEAPPLLAQRALQGTRLLIKDRTAYVRFFARTQAEAEDERYWRQPRRGTSSAARGGTFWSTVRFSTAGSASSRSYSGIYAGRRRRIGTHLVPMNCSNQPSNVGFNRHPSVLHLYLAVDRKRIYEILTHDLDQLEPFAAALSKEVRKE